jgi:hypothetical protein
MKRSLGIVGALFFMSCWGVQFPHDADIALVNDIPECSIDSIAKMLAYPESTLCTLTVADLNDSILGVRVRPDVSLPDLPLTVQYDQFNQDLMPKVLCVSVPGSVMGVFKGSFDIFDQQEGDCTIPYHIEKQLVESFNTLPTTGGLWESYGVNDPRHFKLDYPGPRLMFIYDTTAAKFLGKIGMISTFAICGDFSIGVDFELRDDMLSGFSIAFLVTEKPDTSRWVNRAGIVLAGQGTQDNGWIDLRTNVGINISSETIRYSAGRLTIERNLDTMLFQYGPIGPEKVATTSMMTWDLDFDTVWVQMRMGVDDLSRNRHCTWDNFSVDQGQVVFKPLR